MIEEILDPLEQLSRLDSNFNTLNHASNQQSNSSKKQESVGNYTLDEARDFIRKNLTHKWVDGNSKAGVQQQLNSKRGSLKQPVQITKHVNDAMD